MDCEGGGKPHVVCIPAAAQSHIKLMIGMAKLFFHRGFHVTFVTTELNHKRMVESGPLPQVPGFSFQVLPDGPRSSGAQDMASYVEDGRTLLAPLRQLVAKLNDSASSGVPPVTCIFSDAFVVISHIVARELGVPLVAVFPTAASCSMAVQHYPALIHKGLIPLKDESYLTNGYLDQNVDWIPGMKDIRLRDLPGFIRTTNPNDPILEISTEVLQTASKASAVVIHSFYELEQQVLDALSSFLPRISAIGPLPILLKQLPQDSPLESIGDTLWKEEHKCFQWLNSWPPNSVLYVNFGSTTVKTRQQLIEFGWGLANSKFPFLWIIRPDMVTGDSALLPPEFVEDTKERGMFTSWCVQEQVLEHPSIGGFLTHVGWNSVLESISAGKPMLCWPFFGDQFTYCRYVCKEYEIGMEIDDDVKRDEVAKLVRELMEGDKGKKMKSKAMEWKRKAEEATGIHGSSTIALDKLISEVLLLKH